MKNERIRAEIKKSRFFLWEVAQQMGICEMTLLRWLRFDLPPEKEEKILNAIAALKAAEER